MPVEQKFKNIDAYIASFSEPNVQEALRAVRQAIKEAAPDAEERISYHMPAFFQDGSLVYFSAYKKHIGMYGIQGALAEYHAEVAPYLQEKGSLRFPLNQPVPTDLVSKLVKFGVKENAAKAAGEATYGRTAGKPEKKGSK